MRRPPARSPNRSTIRSRPAIRIVLLAPVVLAVLALALTAGPARANICEQAIAVAAQRHGVDRHLMLAISRVESGLTPWVINAEGAGQRFATKAEAMARVAELQAAGVTSIDVGCMQVNLRWHPDAFAGLAQAFDPYVNADYAARFLRRLRIETGSWTLAAVRYHSAAPERQAIYGCAVQAEFDRLRRTGARPCVYRPEGRPDAVAVTRPAPASVSPAVVSPAVVSPAGVSPAVVSPAVVSPTVVSPTVVSPTVVSPALAPPSTAMAVFRPSRPDPAAPTTAAPPITEPAPVAVIAPGIRRPQVVRLAGGTDGIPVVTVRGPTERSPRPVGPAARPAGPPPVTAAPVMPAHQPRARVLLMPGAAEPAPVSVISGAVPVGPGFSLD